MSLPATGLQATYRNKLTDVANFLTARHGGCYMIINVSDKSYDISEFKNQVLAGVVVMTDMTDMTDMMGKMGKINVWARSRSTGFACVCKGDCLYM